MFPNMIQRKYRRKMRLKESIQRQKETQQKYISITYDCGGLMKAGFVTLSKS